MISYAGVDLTVPSADLVASLMARLDPSWDFCEFAMRTWPLNENVVNAFRGYLPAGPVRVGTLRWPVGAARFAVGHFLASQEQVDALAHVNASNGAARLVLDDGRTAMQTDLHLLPPRPIDQIEGASGLYLLTLVDERFLWWWKQADITIVQGVTTWGDLFDQVAGGLGIGLNVGQIAPVYGFPPGDLTLKKGSLVMMLDAVCYCTGLRLVRDLDGSVYAMDLDTAQTRLAANLAAFESRKTAGGRISPTP